LPTRIEQLLGEPQGMLAAIPVSLRS
jgi:hypothetical protein